LTAKAKRLQTPENCNLFEGEEVMKRTILSLTTAFALMATGALVAQSPQNTTAPGPTQQQEPGQTNNNLPNPGNPQTNLDRGTATYQEDGTVSGTATESIDRTGNEQDEVDMRQGGSTTGTTTGTGTTGTMGTTQGTTTGTGTSGLNQGTTGTGTEVDVDMENDQGTTGTYGTTGTDTTTGAYDDTDTLPDTASELPTFGLIGLLALGAAFALRAVRRNA
jgi:MYXO-CTERM domain-containing protein